MVKFGEYITLFSLEYFIYIGILVVCAWLLFSQRAWVRQHPEKVTRAILIVSIGQQILLYSSYLYLFDFSLGESFPFHLSRISSILGIIYLLTKNKQVFTVLCYLSPFAWLSFGYPSRVYGIFHPIGISFVVNHVITLLLPFFGMIAYQHRLEIKDRLRVFSYLIGYTVFCLILNPLVDGNYFYLKHRPIFSNLPLSIYVLRLLVFSFVLFLLAEVFYNKSYYKLQRPRTGVIKKEYRS